jgi:hypothetical protein
LPQIPFLWHGIFKSREFFIVFHELYFLCLSQPVTAPVLQSSQNGMLWIGKNTNKIHFKKFNTSLNYEIIFLCLLPLIHEKKSPRRRINGDVGIKVLNRGQPEPEIRKPFKEPRNRFLAWRSGTTKLFDVPARQDT